MTEAIEPVKVLLMVQIDLFKIMLNRMLIIQMLKTFAQNIYIETKYEVITMFKVIMKIHY